MLILMDPSTVDERRGSVSGSAVPEVEWQFDAVDLRPVDRWLRAPRSDVTIDSMAGVREQVDVYADTADWRLHRGGYSLRVRGHSGTFEATLKSITTSTAALKRRTEVSAKVPTTDFEDIRELEGPIGRVVRAMAGSHPLQQLVEIRTQRSTFGLSVGGARVGEIVLDSTTIPIEGGEPARLQRVEVEVAPEAVERLHLFVEEFRESCGLTAAPMSKLDVGFLATGRSPSASLDFGPTTVGPEVSTGELAFAVLREQFEIFLRKEPGTRFREDPEELHDMRVATRRMRAALGLFGDALPVRLGRLGDELKWVAGVLGGVRDLDVQLDQVDAWERDFPPADRSSFQTLRGLLEDKRRSAEAAMIAALDSARYERLVARFAALLRRGPLRRSVPSRTPILVAGPDVVARPYRRFRKAGRGLITESPPEAFHKLRIRAKRLRYALEFTEPVYGKRAKALIKRLTALQDLLGEHQDAQVAMQRLCSLVEEHGPELEPNVVFAMGRVAERYGVRADELRRRFDDVYAPMRRRWRRLRRRMETRRDELGWSRPQPMSRAPAPVAVAASEVEPEARSATRSTTA